MSEDHTSGISSSAQGPCVVCKHQRKKCTDECLLKHHFGPHNLQDFELVLKVFGISRIYSILRKIPFQDSPKAIKSLVWESSMWETDPINGPFGYFNQVQQDNASMRNQINMLNLQVQSSRNGAVTPQFRVQEFNNDNAVGVLQNPGNIPVTSSGPQQILQGQDHLGYIPAGNMNFSGVNTTVHDLESRNFNNRVRENRGIQEFNNIPSHVNFPVTGSGPSQILQGQGNLGYIPAGNMNFSGVNSTVQDLESRNFNNRVRGNRGFQELNNNAVGSSWNHGNSPATGSQPPQILQGQDHFGYIPAGSMNFNGGNSVQGFESRNSDNRVTGIRGVQEFNNNAVGLSPNCVNFPVTSSGPMQILRGQDHFGYIPAGSMISGVNSTVQDFGSRNRGFQNSNYGDQNQFGGEWIGSNFNHGNLQIQRLPIEDNRRSDFDNPQDDVKIPEGTPVVSHISGPAPPKLPNNTKASTSQKRKNTKASNKQRGRYRCN